MQVAVYFSLPTLLFIRFLNLYISTIRYSLQMGWFLIKLMILNVSNVFILHIWSFQMKVFAANLLLTWILVEICTYIFEGKCIQHRQDKSYHAWTSYLVTMMYSSNHTNKTKGGVWRGKAKKVFGLKNLFKNAK